eukprot:jgi/Bigna1/57804/fgenesh1_pm.30_\
MTLCTQTLARRTATARTSFSSKALPAFNYTDLFAQPRNTVETPYRKLTGDYVSTSEIKGRKVLHVEAEGLTLLAQKAMEDIAHLLRPGHLQQVIRLFEDPEATENDRFVALQLLKNANIASAKILPGCQDTGTAIVMGKKGQYVWTEGSDEEALSRGVYNTYTGTNLRYSQVAPLDMYKETNTATNLPAQIDIFATEGDQYKFLFMAKGGGSANKTFLFQQTKAVLNSPEALRGPKIDSIGTSACPPYHLAVCIGGLSAEMNLKTVKLASARYLDDLPTEGTPDATAFRCLDTEKRILEHCQQSAQFGGKYFAHDVRVIRLPRHGASCPIGVGVSCSADRQALGKITEEGIFLEQLETDVMKYMPEVKESDLSEEVVKIDLNQPMEKIRETLSQFKIRTRLSLSGTLVVARDIAHAKLQELIDSGEGLPDYIRDHIVYYAGPAKTPEGYASGSFGPTTAGRMDTYVDQFMANGGSMVMLAKGNRSRQVTNACKKHGGFYLGSIGGPAAVLAEQSIKKVECLAYEELGMEAIWRIEVEDFPAFIVVDDKGNDFFAKWSQ